MFTVPVRWPCLLALKRYEGPGPSILDRWCRTFVFRQQQYSYEVCSVCLSVTKGGKWRKILSLSLFLKNVLVRRRVRRESLQGTNRGSMFGTDEGTKERRRRLIATMGRAEEGREGEERKVEGDARWMDGWMELMRWVREERRENISKSCEALGACSSNGWTTTQCRRGNWLTEFRPNHYHSC